MSGIEMYFDNFVNPFDWSRAIEVSAKVINEEVKKNIESIKGMWQVNSDQGFVIFLPALYVVGNFTLEVDNCMNLHGGMT